MSMAKFIARKALEIVLAPFVIATLIFVLHRMMPATPVSAVLSDMINPGLCVTFLALSFCLVGLGAQQSVNPRLREREP